MALDQAANFVREDVTSAISAGDTTINVADASPFPVPPEGYNIVVWDGAAYVRPDQDPDVEIMRVTDTDTTNDTLTVARGQEGTSDVSHPDTSVVVVAQTAKMIADIASEKISNPVTETVNVDGNDVTNVRALDVGGLNNVTYVDPNDSIQNAIDNAAGGRPTAGQPIYNIVRLHPEKLYTENVVLKDDVLLHLNGANLTQANDNVPLVDMQGDNCRLAGPGYVQPLSGFTADSILVDTSNFNAPLKETNQNTVGVWPPVTVRHSGNETATGLRLKAEDYGIAGGNNFGVVMSNPADHIVLEVNNGNFINGPRIKYRGCPGIFGQAAIRHTNNAGNAGAAGVYIDGYMQADPDATHGISNETSIETSVTYVGQIYDPGNFSGDALNGPGLKVVTRPGIGTRAVMSEDVGQTINGVGYQALGGSGPDATNWTAGNIIMDTDNDGDAYFIYTNDQSSGFTQIGT